MKQVELVWASNSPEWEDVSSQSDRVVYDGERLRVEYSGATDDEGHYEGQFELELREGIQSIEGEYTVYPPKASGEQFTQVVAFGLTGQIKPLAAGGHYFNGVWEEGGVAQEFRLAPVIMPGAAAEQVTEADEAGSVFQVDTVALAGLPAGMQMRVQALREFELALLPLKQLVSGVAAFAEFATLFNQLDAVTLAAKLELDNYLAKRLTVEAIVDYLRDEASMALETLLDHGASASSPETYPEELAEFVADIETLSENLHDTVLRHGYELCRVWLGLAD